MTMKNPLFPIIFTLMLLFPVTLVWGLDLSEDSKQFQRYNPDGNKYEFVKNYLISLGYLHLNTVRSEQFSGFDVDELEEIDKVSSLRDNLVLDNVNLRVARNLVEKFRTPENGLILKVVDLFASVCDEQISINAQEKDYLEKLYDSLVNQQLKSVDLVEFAGKQRALANERKESLKGLLEASLLVQKVLISNTPDISGEFTYLGITDGEREKLLMRLDEFSGSVYEGELRQGQSFVEGSISVIRGILEDYSWQTLDG